MESRPYQPRHDGGGEVYLVTGGEGCLGRHLVEALVRYRPAAEIRVFARQQRHFDDPPRVSYALGDLTDSESLMKACSGVTVVFHVASLLSTNTEQVRRVNIDGTRYLLDAAKKHGVARVIFVGTITAVLNRSPIYDGEETLPYATNPLDPYMAVKGEAERMVMTWGELHNVPVCTLRPPLMFGGGDRHLAPVIMSLARKPFSRWRLGDGAAMNVMYVENAAVALLHAEERLRPGSPICGQVFNVHDGYTVDLYELARDFARAIDLPNADKMLTWRVPTTPVRCLAYVLEFFSAVIRPVMDWAPPLRIRDVMLVEMPHTFSAAKAYRMLEYAPVVSRAEALQRTRPWLQKLYGEPKHST
ncbi:hypothetical protein THASP1DRAFT_33057 [Thamnocephalis sphaerospora]|uniref:3-beta hydroxysteroid dehydrogenase/isomerase domain-containing protein n=1 Tax=Thamnocephalis sphaerospora TaxID=78915 RepID=A0A4P9XHH7_9FUNG|nr:hypothetical protein THASP1DRAFT_33057 [Thamnocephalis sphaerospora]|eukprot:RKP05108.1 hypothetical protein THASP1DRAFT_33057 [Thamnocephalis sphaerospora]